MNVAIPQVSIDIDGLAKRYRLGGGVRTPWGCLRDWLAARQGRAPAATTRELWALRDIRLTVHAGEVLGIIGPNGAGKSTLLKILSRITEPTSGTIRMRGQIASLLEVGTGFHPELSGRDNIYLNGSILGLTLRQIRQRFDAIVDFAGVELFLDTPVKKYSSGMYIRLAFAVAAHLEPEILVIDEVLAVGDVAFQRKCLGKMQSIADGGRTVLFVSHNMAAINHFCSRAICLRDGRIVADGAPAGVIGEYLTHAFANSRSRSWPENPQKRMQLRGLSLHGVPDGPGGVLYRTHPLDVRVAFDVREAISGAMIGIVLEKPDGAIVCQTRDVDCEPSGRRHFEPGRYETVVRLPGNLLNAGTYAVRPSIESAVTVRESLDHQQGLTFELHDPDGQTLLNTRGGQRPGVLFLNLPWQTQRAGDLSDVNAAQPTTAEAMALGG